MARPSLLIIGGSGFVSGTLAREAVAQGYDVWAVTRGQKPLPPGVTPLVADRKDAGAFRAAVERAPRRIDLVVDCIAYQPANVAQDIEAFVGRAEHFVLISTDFVYSPAKRRFPQPEEPAEYLDDHSYGANKRRCELELIEKRSRSLAWTILRPCHIYGPGSLLGCSAPDNRDAKLIEKLRAGQPIPLVGPQLLQQPIFAPDLAELILSVRGSSFAAGRVFNAAGPDVIESRVYYQHVADTLGVPLTVEEMPVQPYLQANPDKAPFLCHRFYDLTRLREAGLTAPSTPVAEGLRQHVRSLLAVG